MRELASWCWSSPCKFADTPAIYWSVAKTFAGPIGSIRMDDVKKSPAYSAPGS